MSALLKKEIRLLAPAWAAAMVLAVIPAWWFGVRGSVASYTAFLGAAILAVTSFGREFAMGTFSNLLSQPVGRARIWMTKVVVLVAALIFVAAGFWFAQSQLLHPSALRSSETLMMLLALPLAIAGGFWTSLLLRQMLVAIWFAVLTPVAVGLVALSIADHAHLGDRVGWWMVAGLLLLYAVAGIAWSWRMFRGAQDTQWAGGFISVEALPFSSGKAAAAMSSERRWKPVLALVRKEFQLQETPLLCMAALFALHIAVIGFWHIPHAPGDETWNTIDTTLGFFGGFWLFIPFIACSASLAEEGKTGVIENRLCLPVSVKVQFAIKWLACVLVGGVLAALLLCSAEVIGVETGINHGVVQALVGYYSPRKFGATSDFFSLQLADEVITGLLVLKVVIIFVSISVGAFFSSSLFRNVLQSLIGGALVFFGLNAFATLALKEGAIVVWRYGLSTSELAVYLAIPLLGITFTWLARQNFQGIAVDIRMWRRNVLGLLGTLAVTVMLASAIYHQAWDLLIPLRPARERPLLSLAEGPAMSTSAFTFSFLFPNGRLWLGEWSSDNPEYGSASSITKLEQHRFMEGAGWSSVATTRRATIAIKSDGSLWFADARTLQVYTPKYGFVKCPGPFAMERFGSETDWKSVIRAEYYCLLLKQDGSLWRWGAAIDKNEHDLHWRHQMPYAEMIAPDKWADHAGQPTRFGPDIKWAELFSNAEGYPCVGDADGQVWVIAGWDGDLANPRRHSPDVTDNAPEWYSSMLDIPTRRLFTPGYWIYRSRPGPDFVRYKWRSLCGYARWWGHEIGVRDDGTLWTWGKLPDGLAHGSKEASTVSPVQFGNGREWRTVTCAAATYVGLKKDGTLWRYPLFSRYGEWERLDAHSDWVALGSTSNYAVSLAADGSLWSWDFHEQIFEGYGVIPGFYMAPPRKPHYLGNIFSE